jgi:hypothetical protein
VLPDSHLGGIASYYAYVTSFSALKTQEVRTSIKLLRAWRHPMMNLHQYSESALRRGPESGLEQLQDILKGRR